MSQRLISLSPDLKKLRDEGYAVEIKSSHLLVRDVPYVDAAKQVKRGVLVSTLMMANDKTQPPDTHALFFDGDHPCNVDGTEIVKIKHSSESKQLAPGVPVQHMFSARPVNATGTYKDYYEKMTTYVDILSGPARALDPTVTAQTYRFIPSDEPDDVFNYIDTASSRAGIGMVTPKLERGKIAIVGLGGTGSYVLDLIAKTPVKEIHLFDGDRFFQHNAFRAPGAATPEGLEGAPFKVDYFTSQYSPLRKGIIPHAYYVTSSNVGELHGMEFAFLCVAVGNNKKVIVESLVTVGIPFIDVGMGLNLVDASLTGILRITTATKDQHDHLAARVPFAEADANDDYDTNIQIADLNALNASLAVIKWKKLCEFYLDLEKEHHTTYTIDGNILTNEVCS